MALVRIATVGGYPGRSLWMWCPACDEFHRVGIDTPHGWTWDGNEDAPTIDPSIRVTAVQWKINDRFYRPTHGKVESGEKTCCHSFVRAGQWQYLDDCTHELAGQTVPMVPIPVDWLDDA